MSVRNYTTGTRKWGLQSAAFQPLSAGACTRPLDGWRYSVKASCSQVTTTPPLLLRGTWARANLLDSLLLSPLTSLPLPLQSVSGAQTNSVLKMQVVANKTACFTAYDPAPATVTLAGSISMRGTRAAPRSSKSGPAAGKPAATRSFCSPPSLRGAGFPARVADRRYETLYLSHAISRSMLVEPAMRIFNAYVRPRAAAGARRGRAPAPRLGN
jgi:hypothetical protein